MLISVDTELLKKLELTPNQYCLAKSIHFKDTEAFITLKESHIYENYFKEDIFKLILKGYLINPNEDQYKIVVKDCSIEKINFDEQIAEVKPEIIEEDEDELPDTGPIQVVSEWDKFVQNFRNIFPKGVTTGGKYVRSSSKDCEKKLKQFIKEYEFENETILKATEKYVSRYQMQGYKFMKTASYFILKDKVSALADECEMLSEDDSNGSNGNLFMSGV